LRDVASDQQALGLRAQLVFDRETASRLGITPNMIDQTLYDSYGQRQVSTMFTQLNQYHVVLEVKPGFQQDPIDLRDLFIRSGMSTSTTGVVAGGTATPGVGRSSTTTASAPSNSSPSSGTTAGAFSGGPAASSMVYQNGNQVPLNAFTHLESTTAPIAVNH